MKEKEIEYKRRTGNGQTRCKLCEKKGRWGLNWDSMMYDVLGVEFPICYQCLKEMKEKGEVMK